MAHRRAKVGITNLHRSYRLNARLLKKIIAHILKLTGFASRVELEVIFLNDNSIKALNKRYKGKNRPTDVLAFTITKEGFAKGDDTAEAYISIDRAVNCSKKLGISAGQELVLYIIHAILHICGYDDETSQDRKAMWKKQEEALRYLWKQEDLSKVLMLP